MPRLTHLGITASLPGGFEGRIFQRPVVAPPAQPEVVAHFGTFAIPATAGDFGGGAVQLMGPDDVFCVLFEYGQQSVGKALFAQRGMPRSIPERLFSPFTLRRGIQGQSGTQLFFTEAGRPFTLYAVLGSHARRRLLIPRLDALLAGLDVQPRLPAGFDPTAN